MRFGTSLNWEEFKTLFPGLAPVVIPIAIILVVITIAAIVSLLRKKPQANQMLIWLAVIIFIVFIGPVIYFAFGSKMLDEKEQSEGYEQ